MGYRRNITSGVKLFYEQVENKKLHQAPKAFSQQHCFVANEATIFPSQRRVIFPTGAPNLTRLYPTPRKEFRIHISQPCFFANGTTKFLSGKRIAVPTGSAFIRNFSSRSSVEALAVNNDIISNVLANVSADMGVAAAPILNEVAVAAAESCYPLAMLQFFIDNVHSFTGLDWWASIMIVTTLIRTLLYPLILHQKKAAEQVKLLRPKLDEVSKEIEKENPIPFFEGVARVRELYKEYGVSVFTPYKGEFISLPIYAALFTAVWNMAEKVPSFKDGGALWFTDLSTPDCTFTLPVLTALTYLFFNKLHEHSRPEVYHIPSYVKLASRFTVFLTITWASTLPKAVLFSWLIYSWFPFFYGMGYLTLKVLPAKCFTQSGKVAK